MCFITPLRLAQDLESEIKAGQYWIAEANVVLLPEITFELIQNAINGLAKENFFSKLKGV
jgi:hypothetical protein